VLTHAEEDRQLRREKIEAQKRAQPKYRVVADPAAEPIPEGHLRFVCISDTHSMHSYIKDLPAGDVRVVIAIAPSCHRVLV
jgi:hypothetical protein